MNALTKLKKYNQEQIIDLLEHFSEVEKERILEQICKLNFKQI